MKGSIRPNHIAVNNYELIVVGLPPLTPTTVTGLEEKLQTVDLPDRTKASGGNTAPTELTITIAEHHVVEKLAMEAWFRESQDPVLPTYKKAASLIRLAIDGLGSSTYQLIGVFPTSRAISDLDMLNDGEMSIVTWTLSVDAIYPQ